MSKTCVITGASRGIGRAIAVSLSKREDIRNFILISRTEEGLHETAQLMNPNKEIECHAMDLTDYEKVENLIASIGERYGSIDYLLNVAGFANPKSLLETSIEEWEETYKINVHSIFYITKEVVKFMKRTGGKILNVASTAGMTARPGWLAYASSKAAIISMSETLSEELSEYGILVYCISPGRCATELRKILAPDEDPSTIMQPEHVGEIVDHLLSETGICLDGQNIIVRKQVQKQAQKNAEEMVLSEQTT
ncbi:SDR family NAD(P)-dependent oxidoreductase [Heyndrickxia sporothermodurans]|uniref:3-ketoacyl-(Acyl-carrier-protein) reductase n=1 Tax=Heyndrickxia sporothermodurans TaxID=46224 RepID=A0A150LG86_9BACI|nr:SDR family oxidoreductase [Heyndrickxia sporothermodurans]KYD11348.1 3-ketoacyl-(acyl-carrier-protein) reductase [Heyndrickxia sporothermodurans]MBL5766215.1 SDR family oxidoreductase [Heyndrickxia sporothermodurans]MBL5769655.1 SDR family oxidoreductase [Heyndrickxia sporothermodurans]MBL5773551.1 SDR family oxidoreductase [Heyndrickxia sporothermodurans]MBL5776842.1 SDR family oxidoreductase [Heyndrickxia sporothermodurans]